MLERKYANNEQRLIRLISPREMLQMARRRLRQNHTARAACTERGHSPRKSSVCSLPEKYSSSGISA
jgi:hypothetical protein